MQGMTTTHLLYLHGFRSSPRSFKAQRMAAAVQARHPAVHWWCPQLPPSPRAAMDLLLEGTRDWPRERMAVVGSSLGGFYATGVAEETGCRAVLLNPAVHPARDLGKYIGEQTAWHDPGEHFYFAPGYVDELRALERGPSFRASPAPRPGARRSPRSRGRRLPAAGCARRGSGPSFRASPAPRRPWR